MRKFSVAEYLLQHGADVNWVAINGVCSFPYSQASETALSRVLLEEGSLSSLACVSFLLKTGKANMFTSSDQTRTVLHCLGQRTSTSVGGNDILARKAFKLLNRHFQFTKEQLNLRQVNGSTALELAVRNEKAALVDELLLAGAEWDLVEPNPTGGESALVYAMKMLYLFPKRVEIAADCPPKEEQLDQAFKRQRHIALMLCRKARERAHAASKSVVAELIPETGTKEGGKDEMPTI
jgi:hypothetical protein